MNKLHLEYCGGPEWGALVRDHIIPWVTRDVDLGGHLLEVGPGPGLTTDVLRERVPLLTCVEVDPTLAAPLRERLAGTNVTVVEADATDPAATSNAIGSLRMLLTMALRHDLKGPLAFLAAGDEAIDLRIHAQYNPEAITQYNIVPGLMGVVLTMTMVMITGLAITRERERGTMENLLSMPTRPFEVMVGKIIPYILVGYVQVGLILLAARLLFHVPMLGNVGLLLLVAFVFITANLAMGITFSTLAENQLQAVQLSFFFFLPSLLLSGFMFPFRGMPEWAQIIGEVLPLTHFLRVVRGILLKGNGIEEVGLQLWQIALFAVLALGVGIKRYRQTLD